MKVKKLASSRRWSKLATVVFVLSMVFVFCLAPVFAQLDEGAVTGVVQDTTGAVIPNARVTLTEVNTGLVLRTRTNQSGVYVFSPVKIGSYEVSASAPGFATVIQQDVRVQIQQNASVNLKLKPSSVRTTITVTSAPPLLQTQSASVGQVVTGREIKEIPLSGRNSTMIARMMAGVVESVGSRAVGTGDFTANGQRPEENNYILDGIDNNTAAPDYLNGSSYVVNPPPDALAGFYLQTGNYSAEFGHSAGAVMNVSMKTGTNHFHGDAWEYFRNTALSAKNWEAQTKPQLHTNQFGAALGGPIFPNKLFFFAYVQAYRINYGVTHTLTVPTALERQGNFSELLNPALTGSGIPTTLYEPGSAGSQLMICNGQQNVLCPNQIDPVAQKLLNLYPKPNANDGKLFDNYVLNTQNKSDRLQWGTRVDWNLSSKDQAFMHLVHADSPEVDPAPLGPVLDGGGYGSDGNIINSAYNFALSETHVFSPTLVNQVRFGYNYGHFEFQQFSFSNTNLAASLGLGGIPHGGFIGGGLPNIGIGGISGIGPPGYYPNEKNTLTFEIMDDATKTIGNHSIKFGVMFRSVRNPFLSPPGARGSYSFGGLFTSNPGQSHTGFGVADFLADYMSGASIPKYQKFDYAHWTRAAYAEDTWRATKKLTFNLGLRYSYFQPLKDVGGRFNNFYMTAQGPGQGTASLTFRNSQRGIPLSPQFLNLLSSNNIPIKYTGTPSIVKAPVLLFAPRFGFAYSPDANTTFHGGYGIFYGGVENGASLVSNYPYQFTASFPRGNECIPGNCATNGITLETGFSNVLAQGILNNFGHLSFQGTEPRRKTMYTESYNLTFQRAITPGIVASLGYVGNVSRHLQVKIDRNSPAALTDPRLNSNLVEPFPALGGVGLTLGDAISSYNSMQAKIQKRFSRGLSFFASYTWAHSMTDGGSPLGGAIGLRAPNMIGLRPDYQNTPADVADRFSFNGFYILPFGRGQHFLNHGGILNAVLGGWADDLQFVAQTGNPYTVNPNLGGAGPNGAGAHAIVASDPYVAGGAPNPTNPSIACPDQVKTTTHWYNPCAFANPPLAFPEATPGSPVSTRQVSGLAVLPYLGPPGDQLHGPGFERINTSLSKSFRTIRNQHLKFRADIFNVLNTPAYSNPAYTGIGTAAGKILSTRFFQNLSPDARFIQLSVTYDF